LNEEETQEKEEPNGKVELPRANGANIQVAIATIPQSSEASTIAKSSQPTAARQLIVFSKKVDPDPERRVMELSGIGTTDALLLRNNFYIFRKKTILITMFY
jgi:hypothetical protein